MTVAAYIYLVLMLFGVGMIVEMAYRFETGTLTIRALPTLVVYTAFMGLLIYCI